MMSEAEGWKNRQLLMNNNQALAEKLLEKVLNFLAYSQRSRREVLDRIDKFFLKKELNEEEKEELRSSIMDTVEKMGMIDDEAYASNYVEGQIRSGKKVSRKKILSFLYKKGIPKETIEEALTKYSAGHESEIVKELAEKKLKNLVLRENDKRKVKQKLLTYLLGKGFSYETVFNTVEKILD
jgi:regulatory protein